MKISDALMGLDKLTDHHTISECIEAGQISKGQVAAAFIADVMDELLEHLKLEMVMTGDGPKIVGAKDERTNDA